MGKYLISSLPTILLIFSYVLIFFIIVYWKFKARKRFNPVTVKLKRTPGESLRRKLDEINLDITENLTLSVIFPLLILSLHLSQSYLADMPETVPRFLFNFILMLVFTSYFLWKLFIKLRRRENLRLGFDAERAVGQELNNLVSKGYNVFHDVPAGNFNIDHIVVGPTGVFCIETKGRPKSIDIDGNSEHEVTYDGEKLIFPKWIERKPIEQVKRNSDWLAKTLSKSINEEVKVVPALCISGWQIYRESKLKPFTFNGKNSEGLFIKMKGYELTQEMINKIVNQIEIWIDDVEPMAYKK